MFQFAKESAELIRTTVKDIEEQISKIKLTRVQIGEGKYIECSYEFHLTMVDGKVVNELTGTTSTLSCPICKKSQKNFGNLNDSTNEENYEYGMSPLHARIRCMEFLLKLSYTLPQQDENIDENTSMGIRKRSERSKYRMLFKQLGLKVDCPRYGYGNSNDGNTSRRFFANDEAVTRITGIDNEIVKRLGTILNVLN
ncbi:hypothetical protein EVAR_91337_1 [Eumeta japonica]|uniref:Uncharacterized protein n=1 Tax=Eumeta variegata TaxID=151549 RepID=A0A4C1T111_EUMVA|nr:hypothetical protein EVAR_91337_1 [Eumeta japonica]